MRLALAAPAPERPSMNSSIPNVSRMSCSAVALLRDRTELGLARLMNSVVEAGDPDPAVAITQARKALDQAPGGARHDGGGSRMRVPLQQPDVEPTARAPLKPRPIVGRPSLSLAGAPSQAAVGTRRSGFRRTISAKCGLPTSSSPSTIQRIPIGSSPALAERADRRQADGSSPLLSACPAHRACRRARRLERRRLPQLERVDGLDVVVVVEEERVADCGRVARHRRPGGRRRHAAAAWRSRTPGEAAPRQPPSLRAPGPPPKRSAAGTARRADRAPPAGSRRPQPGSPRDPTALSEDLAAPARPT